MEVNGTTLSTLEETDLLLQLLGDKRKGLPSVITLTVVYSIIFITGVIGNVSTCLVIARNTYMHTVTNYYLFSLAVSDTLTLVLGLPPELYCIWEAYPWRFGEPFCIFKAFLTEMTSYSSVLTITAFTIERYIAICHPIKSQTLSNLSRAVKIIICIWLVAAAFAIPYPIYTRVYHYIRVNNTVVDDSLICSIAPPWRDLMIHVFQMSTFVFFVLPMTMITIMYILIGRTLNSSDFGTPVYANSSSTKSKARKAVIKMLVAVVVAFFCCWAPFNAQRLMTSYIPPESWTPSLIEAQAKLFYISGVLFFVGSTVNPILYNLMSKKFRMAFRRSLCRCCYNPDELIELSARSKSVLYSDRSPNLNQNRCMSNMNLYPRSPQMNKSRSGSSLVLMKNGNSHIISNRLTVSNTQQWPSPQSDRHWSSTSMDRLKDRSVGRNDRQPISPCKRRLNIKTNSIVKVCSMTSMLSFTEYEQEIFLELGSFNSHTHLYSKDQGGSPETGDTVTFL
ncbi:pyrokinin-1 receptor-like [Ylistrum balloti]|uniref:pyrokinin-1 receptor-like n=1 Tax=Ylistrum balloti TaxID=509963 RepID=UPI002905E50F|nr:pyrokinin-1 receptor-like [Ylistrum balloti]